MSKPQYPRYVGVRFTEEEYRHLQHLMQVSGSNQSALIRFLVRTAAKRAEAVAAGIQREQAQSHESS